MKSFLFTVAALCLAFLAACSPQPAASAGSIQVLSPWVKSAASGENTAFFMVIKNTSSQPDQLVKAESEISMMTGLHETTMKDNVMSMSEVKAIEVPANGQVELKSGSFHIMAMNVNKELKPGDKLTLKLTFARAGTISVAAEVRKP